MSDDFNDNGLSGDSADFDDNGLSAVAVDTGGKWKWSGGKSGQVDDYGRQYGSPVTPQTATPAPPPPPPAPAPAPAPMPAPYYPPTGYYPPAPAPQQVPVPPPPTGFYADPASGQYFNPATGQSIPISMPAPSAAPPPAPVEVAPAPAEKPNFLASIPPWGYAAAAGLVALAFYFGGRKK